ncbi:hypothetical protein Q0590_11275 [Rhodocytophaga aerolata]|uniref:DUF892 family protein n=1 Tax=Rhodocytophaga aerolata TaxID=455078 RepID=A0ABT8R427_9BACT|nr:hypothetical protein [Rhodocytophaga aerolata]MDO1446838.1 hypothetical protein [Rhodocytophaga aerolata]
MPKENAVSIQIPAAELKKMLDAFKIIESVLRPYLIALTPEERKQLPKMSDKTVPFVEKTLDYAKSNPQFAPSYMSIPELKIDIDAVYTLTQLARPIDQLREGLGDTMMLAGSEAYIAALAYYNSVKQAAKMNVPGARAIYDDLSKRFPGRPKLDTSKAAIQS